MYYVTKINLDGTLEILNSFAGMYSECLDFVSNFAADVFLNAEGIGCFTATEIMDMLTLIPPPPC